MQHSNVMVVHNSLRLNSIIGVPKRVCHQASECLRHQKNLIRSAHVILAATNDGTSLNKIMTHISILKEYSGMDFGYFILEILLKLSCKCTSVSLETVYQPHNNFN